ncbi:MAG: hypothetical protein BGN88_13955 [Clostridiales bacterium 43-6]|mgnify:CR=1 FL=1|nr:MAG: hypothetical protein BGN88_13955 [Clostridiales bacterium 43-6]
MQHMKQPGVYDKKFPFTLNSTKGVNPNSRVLHWHRELEICYVKEGTGKYLINGNEYTVNPGDIFIINNDEIHLCYDDNDLTMLVILFDPSILSGGANVLDHEYLLPFLEAGQTFYNKIPAEENNSRMTAVLSEMEEEYVSRRPFYELMLKSQILRLLTFILRYYRNEDTPRNITRSNIGKSVFEFIDGRYKNPITVQELADIAEMSTSHFSSMFKSFAGVSPMEYIIQKRITSAMEALKTTNDSILDIATNCGFQSLSNFNHIFKKQTGASPSGYRKS